MLVQPLHKYHIPTIEIDGLEQDHNMPELIHCYINDDMPVGKRLLWSVSYAIKPINLKHYDSNNLMIELATISPDEEIGERIISRFLFKSFFVMNIFRKIVSIERKFVGGGIRPILNTVADSKDLEAAFEEIYLLVDGHDGVVTDRQTDTVVLDPRIFAAQSKRHRIEPARYQTL